MENIKTSMSFILAQADLIYRVRGLARKAKKDGLTEDQAKEAVIAAVLSVYAEKTA